MQKAGGIVTLIAGILGLLAALATLFIGGVGGALEAEGASTVIGLGWGGVLFSFACIVLGAVAMSTTSRVIGLLIILSSIAGAVLGGTLVAFCMVLAFVGGILALFPKKARATAVE